MFRHRKVLRDNIHGIPHGGVSRIGLKTGHFRSFPKKDFETIQKLILKFLRNLLEDTIAYTEHARKHTIDETAVRHALKNMNIKIIGEPPTKRCETYATHLKKSRSSREHSRSKSRSPKSSRKRRNSLVNRIKFYQKQHDCVHLPKNCSETSRQK